MSDFWWRNDWWETSMWSYLMQPKMNIGSERIRPLHRDRSSGICTNLLNYDKYMWKSVEWETLCWGALISITFELHILRFLVLCGKEYSWVNSMVFILDTFEVGSDVVQPMLSVVLGLERRSWPWLLKALKKCWFWGANFRSCVLLSSGISMGVQVYSF